MDDKEFKNLLIACQEIAGSYPEGIVFIGGIAVYLYAINNKECSDFAEVTHDADFYISLADMGDLRDYEEVTANRRLSKHQLRKNGFEFDIYTERHSGLIIPYDQIMAYSRQCDIFRLAALEHLLVLKTEAYRDRHASSKGQKDAKDLIRIALLSESEASFNPDLAIAYLGEEHLELLRQIERGPEFLSMAKGNAKLAKDLRKKFSTFMNRLLSWT